MALLAAGVLWIVSHGSRAFSAEAPADDIQPGTADVFESGTPGPVQDNTVTNSPALTNAGEVADLGPAESPAPSPVVPRLSPAAQEILKLLQSGVAEPVLLAFVSNSKAHFDLGSDQIIYLNDLGVASTIVTAMIQRDTALSEAAAQPAPANPDDPSLAPMPPADNGTPPPVPMDNALNASSDTPGQAPATPPDYPTDYTDDIGTGVSMPDEGSDYYYGSLAPYGNWIILPGYGRCWQPIAWEFNHNWRPYCDHGHWVYTDCGWYWSSDYSWGWATFHYGRWFFDRRQGWCWRPDRTWGPAWVSWRQSKDVCGWAPLPPSARFSPGAGFTFHQRRVGEDFDFGLKPGHYTFMPFSHLADRDPKRFQFAHDRTADAFHNTAVINRVTVDNHRVVNRGLNAGSVVGVTPQPLHRVTIQDAGAIPGKSAIVSSRPQSAAPIFIGHPQPQTQPGSLSSQPAGEVYPRNSLVFNGGSGRQTTTTLPSYAPEAAQSRPFPEMSAARQPSTVQPHWQTSSSGTSSTVAGRYQVAPARNVNSFSTGNYNAAPTYHSSVPVYQSAPAYHAPAPEYHPSPAPAVQSHYTAPSYSQANQGSSSASPSSSWGGRPGH